MENVMNNLIYGLFVLSVKCYSKDNACIINTAIQEASSPNTISISVNKLNHTAEMLNYVDDFTISVISEDVDFALFKRFGFCSGRDVEKFDNFDDCVRVKNGTYAITKGTNSYISAHIDERIDLGSHTLIIATVTDMGKISDAPSATYGYYHTNIKPKPQNNTETKAKTVWRCKVCGYEYEGENIPEDFICPICKHGVADFEKL